MSPPPISEVSKVYSAEVKADTLAQNIKGPLLPTFMNTPTLTFEAVKLLFMTNDSIQDSHRGYFFERDGIANQLFTRQSFDMVNKWFEVETDVVGLKEDIERVNEEYHVKRNFRLLDLYSQIWGYSALLFNWIDRTDKFQDDPTGEITGLDSIKAIPKTHIDSLVIDKNMGSPTFGEVTHYKILRVVEGKQDTMVIPAARFLHYVNRGIRLDAEGYPQIDAIFDDLLGKKNMDYASLEAAWKAASRMYTLKLPESPTDEDLTWAQNYWKDFNVKDSFAFPHGYDVNLLQTKGGTDFSPMFQEIYNKLGSGTGVGKTILLGTEAGAVVGAEYNFKQYAGHISNQQTERLEIGLRHFYEILQENGLLKEGSFKIIWNPLLEQTEEEIAQTDKLYAENAKTLADAFTGFKTAKLRVHFQDDDVFVYNPKLVEGGKTHGIRLEGIKGQEIEGIKEIDEPAPPAPPPVPPPQPPEPEPAPPDLEGISLNKLLDLFHAQNKENLRVTKQEKFELEKKWAMKDRDEAAFADALQTFIVKYQQEWYDKVESLQDDLEPIPQNVEFPGQYKNATGDALDILFNFEPSGASIQSTLEEFMERAYADGWAQTADALGQIDTAFPIDQPAVRALLEQEAPVLKKRITQDLNNKFLTSIREGIKAGEDYKRINDRLKGISKDYNSGIPNTVHKVVAEAQNTARIDELQKEGETEGLWLTVGDDRVRPEHVALEQSNPHKLSELYGFLGDYGCRCTIAPVPELTKLRSE